MTLRVVAHVNSKPEKVAETKTVLMSLLEPTRQEAGCISYILLQNNEDPAKFTFVEEWDNAACLQAHLKTPHVSAAFEKMPVLLDGAPDIGQYTLVG
jgi:quinol monooxygenase YgiN